MEKEREMYRSCEEIQLMPCHYINWKGRILPVCFWTVPDIGHYFSFFFLHTILKGTCFSAWSVSETGHIFCSSTLIIGKHPTNPSVQVQGGRESVFLVSVSLEERDFEDVSLCKIFRRR